MMNPLILMQNDMKIQESSQQGKVKIIQHDVSWIMNTSKIFIDK